MSKKTAHGANLLTRKVNEAEAKAFRTQFDEFQRLSYQQPSLQEVEDGTQFFIVSMNFIKKYKEFCLSKDEERQLPPVMNQDLMRAGTKMLRAKLVENKDFKIVSQSVWATFGKFQANEIKRELTTQGTTRRVPIYLKHFRYIVLLSSQVKDTRLKNPKRKTIKQSQQATVEQLANNILKKEGLNLTHVGRLWSISQTQSTEAFLIHVRPAFMVNPFRLRIIEAFGKRLKNNLCLYQTQAASGWLVLQVCLKNDKWFMITEVEKICQGCRDFKELLFPCICKQMAYCSKLCLEIDRNNHMRLCQSENMRMFSHSRLQIGEGIRYGRVGLRNLGNTCFMNSCLQCLSSTVPLTSYFLQGFFEAEINIANPMGNRGSLPMCYVNFIRAIWYQKEPVHTPDEIMHAVNNLYPMFKTDQHDVHEFFSFFIDRLHEDLNRVLAKPTVQAIESAGRSDTEVAAESWLAHMKRNQSIITDLMAGQYKSKVTCPTCQWQSITFDPFITVTLPLAKYPKNNLECFFFSHNFQEPTLKIYFRYAKPDLAHWKQNISKITGVPAHAMQIWLVSKQYDIYLAKEDSMQQFASMKKRLNRNIFVFEMSEQEQQMVDPINITVRFAKKEDMRYSINGYENLWFKIPFMMDWKATGASITRRILQFLYPTAYTDRQNTQYAEYEAKMIKMIPFTLVLMYQKKTIQRFYRQEQQYMSQLVIRNKTTLQQLSQIIKQGDCMLDVRFSDVGLSMFDFKRLYQSQDFASKGRSRWEGSVPPVELTDCFRNLSEEEQLQKVNEWYCPYCKTHKRATKVIQIYKAPKVLILHLKRFRGKESNYKEKNETLVHFPFVLDMSPFLIDHAPMASYNSLAAQQDIFIPPKHGSNFEIACSSRPIYDLYAVSNHYVALGGGHYTTYAKNRQKWFEFNDTQVTEISRERIQGSSAYLLFYMRREE